MPALSVTIRPEAADDVAAIRAVHVAAFPTDAEADLVEALRERCDTFVSLVAEDETGAVIGHVLFTPVTIGARRALGLAPLAVRPDAQRLGVGAALTRAGLAACEDRGAGVVVVLGHPGYYPRFGFVPAWEHGIWFGERVEQPALMVLELAEGTLAERRGEVRYHPAFDAV